MSVMLIDSPSAVSAAIAGSPSAVAGTLIIRFSRSTSPASRRASATVPADGERRRHATPAPASQRLTGPSLRHSPAARGRPRGAVLRALYRGMAAGRGGRGRITPAAERVRENYHYVEKQIAEICQDL